MEAIDIIKKTSPCAKSVRFVIHGSPTPLARARYSTKSNRVWDCQKQIKLATGIEVANIYGDTRMMGGSLHLEIYFYFQSSKQHKTGKYHVFKPDLSNLIKFIEDVCTGIIYNDDCLISSISAHKIYDTKPRTEFELWEI